MKRDQLAAEPQLELQQTLAKVMDAVNAAKDGRLIDDSELPVLHLMKELECRVFQKALQLRVDSAESTFSHWNDSEGKPKHNKGLGECSRLTMLGRVGLLRTRYYDAVGGSDVSRGQAGR